MTSADDHVLLTPQPDGTVLIRLPYVACLDTQAGPVEVGLDAEVAEQLQVRLAEHLGEATEPMALTWADEVATRGVGATRRIDIDVRVPGIKMPVPVELPLADARDLHAMLGRAIAAEDGLPAVGWRPIPQPDGSRV